jgi:hypothetical protein
MQSAQASWWLLPQVPAANAKLKLVSWQQQAAAALSQPQVS